MINQTSLLPASLKKYSDGIFPALKNIWPLLLGAFFFLVIVGHRVIDPTNIAWLGDGYDPTQHYLGWVFFRHGPWSFPLGLNPTYGLDISSAIVYSDSIPWLAFLFKPFSGLLPEPFQYIGIWMFLCFILQAFFGWKLLSLFSQSWITRSLAVGLLVVSPPMLFRFGLHAALGGIF